MNAWRAGRLLEPIDAIGHPPAHYANRDCRAQCPPERKKVISRETQDYESDPEDLSLHAPSLTTGVGDWGLGIGAGIGFIVMGCASEELAAREGAGEPIFAASSCGHALLRASQRSTGSDAGIA